jgi:hypothetical protein
MVPIVQAVQAVQASLRLPSSGVNKGQMRQILVEDLDQVEWKNKADTFIRARQALGGAKWKRATRQILL